MRDVVNEPLERPAKVLLPKDYTYWSMTEAARDFPSTTKLDVNETGAVWTNFHEEDSPFYLLLENLRMRGVRVDDIGFQFLILFNVQLDKNVLAGKAMKPLDMLRVLDFYQKLQLPISISEITIPTLPCTAEGEATQAELVADYYRLWFSHPAVKAITWWNLPDGTAAGTENRWAPVGCFVKTCQPSLRSPFCKTSFKRNGIPKDLANRELIQISNFKASMANMNSRRPARGSRSTRPSTCQKQATTTLL